MDGGCSWWGFRPGLSGGVDTLERGWTPWGGWALLWWALLWWALLWWALLWWALLWWALPVQWWTLFGGRALPRWWALLGRAPLWGCGTVR
ncbi:hypothetical protein OG439_33080 [Amycolatopsis sp. NBC_01307]|uniref:hypothetical protein n=1 Tax=Amycolatopsis sp. NBC_01307 TaxID=2903561 RepID=UPI002E1214E5|nr:hypothetical protein OG439_33080 [Amycolatopsis sp. NBC_01307]